MTSPALHPVPAIRRTISLAAGWCASAALAGCAALGGAEEGARRIDLAAFARHGGSGEPTGARAGAGADATVDPAKDPLPMARPAEAPPAPAPLGAGGASRSSMAPLQTDERIFVDGMVGQVNGRPIFAHDFFVPIEDQIVAIRAQATTAREFVERMRRVIAEELQAVVINALFLAEAETGLTTEEQQGIFAWLRKIEEEVIAQHESETAARQAIQASEEKSLEAHLATIKDRALIGQLLRERVSPYVIVSWRDVARRYEEKEKEFRPPAHVEIARILIATERDADLVQPVTERIAAGESFLDVAASLERPGCGPWQAFDVAGGDMTTIDLENEAVRDQLRTLAGEGDHAGPFAVGGYTWWLGVTSFVQPPVRDLYDPEVQRALAAELRSERSSEEYNRYVTSLFERGIYDDMRGMEERLLRIAVMRYGR
jgi:hypothetical protein